MAEYIKRETAIEIVKSGGYWETEDMEVAVTCIEQTPTADVVEVVRCKDCKYQTKVRVDDKRYKEGSYILCGCINTENLGEDEEFCSHGERRDIE